MRQESEGSCHIDELRREISGLSQLASELYSVTQTSDTDRVSLDRSNIFIYKQLLDAYVCLYHVSYANLRY